MQPEDANRKPFAFPKSSRICSRLQIENLLKKKQKVFCYPFKCFYDFRPATDGDCGNQMLVSVPKRHFKHAVDRNRLKRLTREAYRLQHGQHLDSWTAPLKLHADIFFCYVADEILPYSFVENKIIEILKRLRGLEKKANP